MEHRPPAQTPGESWYECGDALQPLQQLGAVQTRGLSVLSSRTKTFFHFQKPSVAVARLGRSSRARIGGRSWSLGCRVPLFSRAPPAPFVFRYVYFKWRVVVLAVISSQLFRWPV
jgi:hypothetical protein